MNQTCGCVGLRALEPWISKGKITAGWDSVDEDYHSLYTGDEVRLKPSTNQTEYQLLSRRQQQSVWRENKPCCGHRDMDARISKHATHNTNRSESAQVRNTATSYDISYTALCDHHLPAFLRGWVGVFFQSGNTTRVFAQLSPQPPSLHGWRHFSLVNFKCVENERQSSGITSIHSERWQQNIRTAFGFRQRKSWARAHGYFDRAISVRHDRNVWKYPLHELKAICSSRPTIKRCFRKSKCFRP